MDELNFTVNTFNTTQHKVESDDFCDVHILKFQKGSPFTLKEKNRHSVISKP